jgi:hypothetical protein
MPLFEPFSHYLAYGATDQETFRALRDSFDGLLVPATIAAWQQQGTGGFVLTLSATDAAPPYVIDPRFPLFQQGLSRPKQSHIALAELFGDTDLIQATDPAPATFGDDRLSSLARRWVEFNTDYGRSANEKFDKYAARLGEPVVRFEDVRGPEGLLAPYFVARDIDDRWWERSSILYAQTRQFCEHDRCFRVLAVTESAGLESMLMQVPERDVAVWVSGLDEYNASVADLAMYRRALALGMREGKRLFALYGGFFSVLLRIEGLTGCAHGVGFSEHRAWRELPQSGAPPARYYARRFHRYISQDLAQELWAQDSTLIDCGCAACAGRRPVALDYHDLMKHSVLCRSEEIHLWRDVDDVATAAEILATEHEALEVAIREITLAPAVRSRAVQAIEHLPRWTAALAE